MRDIRAQAIKQGGFQGDKQKGLGRFEVSEIIRIKADEIWGRTVDGYVALMFGGEKYVESVRD